jgi:uncharacterized Zn-finger protein
MNPDAPNTEGFAEILQSEIAMVKCHGCNTDQPVNKVYLPYLTDGIERCPNCREAWS